ncbi:MAG TPA: alpha/beta hydrolase [Chloroflexota bacterium]|jgi:pimeloyl-ACP methyl ester carboxylesterase
MSTIWVDLLGAEVKYYEAGGLRTRAIEAGSGDALILLHGSGGHAEAYTRNVLPLAERFRVLSVDMIGHGFTDKPEGDYQAPDYARHIVGLMDAAGIERAHIAGESLGGWVAAWTALLHPDRVNKIISITGAGLEVETDQASKEYYERGSGELRRLSRQFVENPTKENLRARLGWLFHDPQRDITDELVELRWAIYKLPGAEQAVARTGKPGTGPSNPEYKLTPERLREIKAPFLFLWTEFNPSMPGTTARRAHEQMPGSQWVELKDCAHWPQWEDPQAFNQAVTRFLAG